MKNLFIVALLVVCFVSVNLFAGEKAPQKVVNLANELAKYGTNSVIVKAVKAQNAQNLSLSEIKKRDEEWKKTPGISSFMSSLFDSECGKYLAKLQKDLGYCTEIFAMDNQGANVALSEKTSDYWQGDEDKFIKSYNNGNGGILISDIEFDTSSQAYIVQISVPVKDAGKVIGAITFGIDVDKVK